MKIHCLLHVSFETPGTMLDWAALRGHELKYTRFFEKDAVLPQIHTFDALLIMGGHMNVDEEERYPWLRDEKRFISDCINAGKKVIGICLGAQLVAAALGAAVYPGTEKEIGFFPLQFSAEGDRHKWFDHFTDHYPVFHWHGDTFDLPASALLIASTTVCKHQAFVIGDNILALQFHPEMNRDTIAAMVANDGNELCEEGKYIQSEEEINAGKTHLEQNKKDLFLLLDKFFNTPL